MSVQFSRRELRKILLCLFFINIVVYLLFYFSLRIDSSQIKDDLAKWTVLSCEISLFLILSGLVILGKDLHVSITMLHRKVIWGLGGLLFLSAMLLIFVSPRVHRLFYDEQVYQSIAQSISWTGQAVRPTEANGEYGEYVIFIAEYNKQPNGFPYYVSLFQRVLDFSEQTSFIANNIAYLLTICALFGTVLLLFSSPPSALLAALFYAFHPVVLRWANTGSAEISAAAFVTIAFFAAALYLKKPTMGSFLFLVGVFVWSAQFRPESLLFLFSIFFLIGITDPKELLRSRFYCLCLLILVLLIPHLMHLFAFSYDDWGGREGKFSIDYFLSNLKVNSRFFVSNKYFPVVFNVFAILGILQLRSQRANLAVLFWFLFSWGVFLFFFAGSYELEANIRYAVLSVPPFSIFCGVGAGWLLTKLKSTFLQAGLGLVILFCSLAYLPYVRSIGNEGSDCRRDVEQAKRFSELLPPDSIILSQDAEMFIPWERNAAQTFLATIDRLHIENDFFSRYRGGVFFHWGYWCNLGSPAQKRLCSNVLNNFDSQLITEYTERDNRYALYQLAKKKG